MSAFHQPATLRLRDSPLHFLSRALSTILFNPLYLPSFKLKSKKQLFKILSGQELILLTPSSSYLQRRYLEFKSNFCNTTFVHTTMICALSSKKTKNYDTSANDSSIIIMYLSLSCSKKGDKFNVALYKLCFIWSLIDLGSSARLTTSKS